MGERIPASFRDPSGVVFSRNGNIFRQINLVCKDDYDFLMSCGLYETLTKKKLLISHREVSEAPLMAEGCYKVIQPDKVDFISYPYEWSFSQLKDAALLTLEIQKEALNVGMVLKDASAYNVQFHQGSPILIDTLSFTKYIEGSPWVAYRQFCQHFLAPLALMSKTDGRLSKLQIDYIDGVPLDLCSRLLPFSSRLNLGLYLHIHLHSRTQSRYANSDDSNKPTNKAGQQVRITKNSLLGLIDSLKSTINGLSTKITGREWADYYSETNYTDAAFEAKKSIVLDLMQNLKPKRVLDMGANTGIFSREAAKQPECLVVSTDIDPEAVEINYLQVKKDNRKNILPLVIDLTNPSPAIGWDNQERDSFYSRGRADVVLALALIHHLAIANNVPLESVARTMAALGDYLVLEFVPKEDSQVKRLLQSRDDIFDHYTLEGLLKAFEPLFDLEKTIPVPESQRTMLLFKRK
jgi:ribosomal protein L11 methylase PrmA